MIRALLVGMARSLFLLAAALAALSLLAGYCSFRLLRAAFAKGPGMPVRDAGFGLMLAAGALVKALEQRNRQRPAPVLDPDAEQEYHGGT